MNFLGVGREIFFDPAELVEAGPAERSASEDFHQRCIGPSSGIDLP